MTISVKVLLNRSGYDQSFDSSLILSYLCSSVLAIISSAYLTALANKPPNLQIFIHSKFRDNPSTGLKVIAKKLI